MKKLLACILFLVFIVLHAGCASPLQSAAYKGDNNTVKELLDKGTDVNETSSLSAPTALTEAILGGHLDTVRLLLDRGADVNKSYSDDDVTPLFFAASEGHTDIANLLIDKGADINKAIMALDKRVGTKKAIELLKEIKRERVANKSVTPVFKSPQELSPIVKSDIDEFPTIKAKSNKNSYAIVIGIENYHQKLPKADFATSDAKLVTEYLTKALGYPEENVVTLLNENATNVALAKYFEKWMPNNVETGSTVFIYFSGHGAPNTKTGDAFLVPYDGDPSFIDQTGYSLKRMYDALGKLPAKKIIVALDSCFSGAGGRSVIAKGSRPLVMNLQANTILPKNMTVLAASSGDQTSSTYDEKGHGLFTYFLLKGIKNEDVVMPDGSIKLDGLFGYIKPQVERIARKQYNNEQSPQLILPKK